LTGRTILYPDITTPEGRALMWLIETDDDDVVGTLTDEDNNGTSTTTTTTSTMNTTITTSSKEKTDNDDTVSLRQRYALATFWFQTPDHFDDTFAPSVRVTWGNSTVHECDWYGVNCSRPLGVVDALRLNRIVRGEIPDDLALLTDLVVLDLSASDQLVGTIPSSLGQHLTALTYLVLFNTALTGTIPSSLAALTELVTLGLLNNALSGTVPSQM
jgi:hypothetical protein